MYVCAWRRRCTPWLLMDQVDGGRVHASHKERVKSSFCTLTDGYTLGMNGTEVAVLKQVNHKVLCGLWQAGSNGQHQQQSALSVQEQPAYG